MGSRSRVALPFVLYLAFHGAPTFAVGEVNLTRLTVTAELASLQPIAADTLQKLCADPEGCEVVLILRFPVSGITKTGRLFLLAGANWFSSDTAALKVDGNGSAATAMTLTDVGSGFECLVTDADALGGVDNALGFALANSGPADEVTCTVTFSD